MIIDIINKISDYFKSLIIKTICMDMFYNYKFHKLINYKNN